MRAPRQSKKSKANVHVAFFWRFVLFFELPIFGRFLFDDLFCFLTCEGFATSKELHSALCPPPITAPNQNPHAPRYAPPSRSVTRVPESCCVLSRDDVVLTAVKSPTPSLFSLFCDATCVFSPSRGSALSVAARYLHARSQKSFPLQVAVHSLPTPWTHVGFLVVVPTLSSLRSFPLLDAVPLLCILQKSLLLGRRKGCLARARPPSTPRTRPWVRASVGACATLAVHSERTLWTLVPPGHDGAALARYRTAFLGGAKYTAQQPTPARIFPRQVLNARICFFCFSVFRVKI